MTTERPARRRVPHGGSHSEQRFRAMFETAAIGIATTTLEGVILDANAAFERMLGYAADGLCGKTVGEITHPDDRDVGLDLIHELNRGDRDSYQLEKRYLRADGSSVWGRVSVSIMRDDRGTPIRIVGMVEDIQARKEAEEQLRAAEARYRTLVEELPLAIYADARGDRRSNLYTSPQIETLLGYSVDEWRSDPDLFARILHPEDRERVLAEVARAKESGERFVCEYRVVARDGLVVWFRDESILVRDDRGRALHSQGYLLDISERKEAEEALRTSEARFRSLADYGPGLVWMADAGAKATFVSQSWLDFTGWTDDEAGTAWFDCVHEDDVEAAAARYTEALASAESFSSEYRLRRADGQYRWILDVARPWIASDGSIGGYIGVGIDVTDRREARAALERRERILQAVARIAADIVAGGSWEDVDILGPLGEAVDASRAHLFENRVDENGRLVATERAEWLSGSDVSPVITDPAAARFDYEERGFERWVDVLSIGGVILGPPRDFPESERVELERHDVCSVLIVPVMADGEWWGSVGFDDCERERVWTAGEIDALHVTAGILGAAVERQRVARSLRETSETLEALVNASAAAIMGFDREGNVTLWNPAAERIFGWSADEVVGRFNPIVTDDTNEQFRASLARIVAGSSYSNAEMRQQRKDGSPIDLSISSGPVRGADGEIVGMASVIVDATEQKQAQRALAESEARFSAFMENSQFLAFMKDEAGRYVYINKKLEEAHGTPASEVIGKTDVDLFGEELGQQFRENDELVRSSGTPFEALERRIAADGSVRDYLKLKFPFDDSQGRILIGGFSLDVTEREQALAQLRETTQTLESIIDNAPLAIMTFDAECRVTSWNGAAEHTFGWSADEVLGRVNPTVPPGFDDDFRAAVSLALAGKSWRNAERPALRKDGTQIDIRASCAPHRGADGEPIGMVALLTNITESKRSERRVATQYAATAALSESATIEDAAHRILEVLCSSLGWDAGGVWILDQEAQVLRCASAWPARQDASAPGLIAPELERGQDLAGAVLQTSQPRWIADAAAVPRFRETPWIDAGMACGFAAPIEAGGDVLGVLALFSSDRREAEADLIAMVTSIGAQIGQFLRRAASDSALREREERYRTLVANVPGAIYRSALDSAWTMDFLSDSIVDLAGYPASDFIGNAVRAYADVMHPDDRSAVTEQVQAAVAARSAYTLEYRIIHADGGVRWVSETGQPIIGPGGEVVWLDGVILDVTERKRAEEEGAQTQTVLDAIVENLPIILFLKDADDLQLVRVNRALEEFMGRSRDELIGTNGFGDVPAEHASFFEEKDRETLASGRMLDIAEEPFGDSFLHTRKVPILDERGNPRYLLGISMDITEAKRADAERERLLSQLEEQNEQLRELDRMKDEFVALVSHELRTPLTSILGYLELILQGEAGAMTPDQDQFLRVVERNAGRLLRLVGDLLFVAQIEAGKLALEHHEIDLATIAHDCIEAARPRATEKEIELVLEGDPGPAILGDGTRLAQLLDNLVSNAIKFTPEGGRVGVKLSRANGSVLLAVTDTGMGIPHEEQEHLFQRFFRTAGATSRAIQGTGLGLTITKAIVEAHGGSISVESDVGSGTTFVVEIPAVAPLTGDSSSRVDLPMHRS